MEKEGSMITDWLNQNANPEIDRFIEKNLAITERMRLAMVDRGWELHDLATEIKTPLSEVSVWVSGMHNLTLKNINKIELALDIDLISPSLI